MGNFNLSRKRVLVFSVMLIVLILVALGVALDYFVAPMQKAGLADYKRQVNSTLSDQEFVEELIGQNLRQRESISRLEGELKDRDIVIGYLMERLNMSTEVEAGPFSRISEEDIKVYSDRIIIYVNKAFPASFSGSKSMYPYIREGIYALEVKPDTQDELKIGDIIGFRSEIFNTTIIHRITEIGEDEEGWYAITKGDNNPAPDPGKVRFGDVVGVLVGLIY
ncbi:signal peptidase I [Candidatus Woesearchaeota archaeon]|nr:signal peptidase I [Candidatus Woesearchaeota archaeon]